MNEKRKDRHEERKTEVGREKSKKSVIIRRRYDFWHLVIAVTFFDRI